MRCPTPYKYSDGESVPVGGLTIHDFCFFAFLRFGLIDFGICAPLVNYVLVALLMLEIEVIIVMLEGTTLTGLEEHGENRDYLSVGDIGAKGLFDLLLAATKDEAGAVGVLLVSPLVMTKL